MAAAAGRRPNFRFCPISSTFGGADTAIGHGPPSWNIPVQVDAGGDDPRSLVDAPANGILRRLSLNAPDDPVDPTRPRYPPKSS